MVYYCVSMFFCFKQKTAYEMRISDWSSDVCSSDLHEVTGRLVAMLGRAPLLVVALLIVVLAFWLVRRLLLSGHRRLRVRSLSPAASQIGRASCRERVCQYV